MPPQEPEIFWESSDDYLIVLDCENNLKWRRGTVSRAQLLFEDMVEGIFQPPG
jgi:hypothetical protein